MYAYYGNVAFSTSPIMKVARYICPAHMAQGCGAHQARHMHAGALQLLATDLLENLSGNFQVLRTPVTRLTTCTCTWHGTRFTQQPSDSTTQHPTHTTPSNHSQSFTTIHDHSQSFRATLHMGGPRKPTVGATQCSTAHTKNMYHPGAFEPCGSASPLP